MSLALESIITYLQMCNEEGCNLQRGMNFRLKPNYSVILMSRRPGAPYPDEVREDGRVLIYEGHDAPNAEGAADPKSVDQPERTRIGRLTQNGFFFRAVEEFKSNGNAELVKVYEKIKNGIWAFNGFFKLVDGWKEKRANRWVFKFRLELTDVAEPLVARDPHGPSEPTRMIPTEVKVEVWGRDKGRCVKCGSSHDLHFDHIIPYSKGGSSLTAENVQLMCGKHNFEKRDRIE